MKLKTVKNINGRARKRHLAKPQNDSSHYMKDETLKENETFKTSKKTELDNYLLTIKKALIGINGALHYEDIPLKLVLECSQNEDDYKHLTNHDRATIKEAPKMLNGYGYKCK